MVAAEGPSTSSGTSGVDKPNRRDRINPRDRLKRRHVGGAPGRFELPPPPPEGESCQWNGANRRQLPRDFNVFRSSWIVSQRLVFREVLPFCCHGRFLGRAFALPERATRRPRPSLSLLARKQVNYSWRPIDDPQTDRIIGHSRLAPCRREVSFVAGECRFFSCAGDDGFGYSRRAPTPEVHAPARDYRYRDNGEAAQEHQGFRQKCRLTTC